MPQDFLLDDLDDLQKIAMSSVVSPTLDGFMRKVYRFFSKTFNVPLNEVEQLDPVWVLTHYFEHVFESLDEEARKEKIEYLLMSPQQRKDFEDKEKYEEEEFMRQLQSEYDKMTDEEAKRKIVELKSDKSLKNKDLLNEEVRIQFTDPVVD